MEKALTVGRMANLLGQPIHRIQYLISSRSIEPVLRAGNLRVFSPETLDVLKKELGINNVRTRQSQQFKHISMGV